LARDVPWVLTLACRCHRWRDNGPPGKINQAPA